MRFALSRGVVGLRLDDSDGHSPPAADPDLGSPDCDLGSAWFGWYTGPDTLRHAGRGLLEPVGVPLGPEAVAMADVVLLPGLAVSADGWRLGRGGGSYDRALARVPVGTFTCVLLYDDEVGVPVPVDPHDRRVRAAASPSGASASRRAGALKNRRPISSWTPGTWSASRSTSASEKG